jgi:hypothetical protein
MKNASRDPSATSQADRLDELEIKVSFLEKELEEYKEASRTFYGRLAAMEAEIEKLNHEMPESSLPTPEATWDSENNQVRP